MSASGINSDVLYDPLHEKFAQMVASGTPHRIAAQEIGRAPDHGIVLLRRPHIAGRIEFLQEQAAKRLKVSRQDVIAGIIKEIKLAETAGQPSAALKGWEMLGKELHGMFRERVETKHVSEFDNMTEDQLKEIIRKDLESVGLEVRDPIMEQAVKAQMENPVGYADEKDEKKDSPIPTNEGSGSLN